MSTADVRIPAPASLARAVVCTPAERLRERLHKGDPDMTADEIQAAMDRAEVKRQELEAR